MAFKKNVRTVFSIQALPKPKIGILNWDINQFFYSEWLIHSKRYQKRNLCIELKENTLSYFSLRVSLPKPKIGKSDLNFHQCFCSKRQFYPIKHLKRINIYCLKGIIRVDFSRDTLPKSKIGLPNLDLTNFSGVND